jgi:hypothetical protein
VPDKRKRESWIEAAFELVGEFVSALFEVLAGVFELLAGFLG